MAPVATLRHLFELESAHGGRDQELGAEHPVEQREQDRRDGGPKLRPSFEPAGDVADGLPKAQREIELLVCHAGESVNTRANARKLLALQAKATGYKNRGKAIPKSLKTKFAATAAKGQAPQFFESAANAAKLLLPMAAQLTQALKDRGFTHFSVISYKAPVSQLVNGKTVYLDLSAKGGRWGTPISKAPGYRVAWH